MTSEQFTYWLQGFSELNDGPPSPEQWTSIREHLQTVFVKVTPPVSGRASPLIDPNKWGQIVQQTGCFSAISPATTICTC